MNEVRRSTKEKREVEEMNGRPPLMQGPGIERACKIKSENHN